MTASCHRGHIQAFLVDLASAQDEGLDLFNCLDVREETARYVELFDLQGCDLSEELNSELAMPGTGNALLIHRLTIDPATRGRAPDCSRCATSWRRTRMA